FTATSEGVTLTGNNQSPTQANAAAAQAATLGNLALITTGVQATNIGIRLAALRQGSTGVSLGGLSLNSDGKSFPVGAVASLARSANRDGDTNAEPSSLLSKLGIFAVGQGSFGNQDATLREPGFDFHTAGITVGADYRLSDQLILGMAFGYL